METSQKDLGSALGIGRREHVALVGGGGKTTLMFALAEQILRAGHKVITTTTTKIKRREAIMAPSQIFAFPDTFWHQELKQGLKRNRHTFIAGRLLNSEKVKGISPELADILYLCQEIDYLIVEADGAAGKPIKAPAHHEPVVPLTATLVVAMVGLDALEKPFDERFVFRTSLFEKLTGLRQGETITQDTIIKIFESSEGLFKGAPISARRLAFLNKADLLPDEQITRDLADGILRSQAAPVDRVVIGSAAKNEYLVIRQKHEGNISENH